MLRKQIVEWNSNNYNRRVFNWPEIFVDVSLWDHACSVFRTAESVSDDLGDGVLDHCQNDGDPTTSSPYASPERAVTSYKRLYAVTALNRTF
jgi:hypothetical protein